MLQVVTVAGVAANPLIYANQAAGAPAGAVIIPQGQAETYSYSGNTANITANFQVMAGSYNNVANIPANPTNGVVLTTYSDNLNTHQAVIGVTCISQQ
ncbi:MAG TPA: hypothetical protein VG537_02175 [Candidatus Kapabacteria bacterium]|jgi:hypothetical protein|nr:hypothetical protein [Candidatus Kapabacteria bacterium]